MSPTLFSLPWWSVPWASAPSDCGARGGHSGYSELSISSEVLQSVMHCGQHHQTRSSAASVQALLCGCSGQWWPTCHSPLTRHTRSFPHWPMQLPLAFSSYFCISASSCSSHLEGAVQTYFSVLGTRTYFSFRFISLLPLSAHSDSEGDIPRRPSLRGNHLA